MNIKPIRTKADHRAALKEIEALMPARRGTPKGERLDVLVTLVESGLAPKDLVPMIGQLNRVYEILSRKRPLTLKMVWRLHRELGIPAESLIKQDDRKAA